MGEAVVAGRDAAARGRRPRSVGGRVGAGRPPLAHGLPQCDEEVQAPHRPAARRATPALDPRRGSGALWPPVRSRGAAARAGPPNEGRRPPQAARLSQGRVARAATRAPRPVSTTTSARRGVAHAARVSDTRSAARAAAGRAAAAAAAATTLGGRAAALAHAARATALLAALAALAAAVVDLPAARATLASRATRASALAATDHRRARPVALLSVCAAAANRPAGAAAAALAAAARAAAAAAAAATRRSMALALPTGARACSLTTGKQGAAASRSAAAGGTHCTSPCRPTMPRWRNSSSTVSSSPSA